MKLFGAHKKPVDEALREIKEQFDRKGFAVLPEFFAAEFCDQVLQQLDLYTGQQRRSLNSKITVDVLHGEHGGRLMRVCDAPDEAFLGPFKVNNLFTESAPIASAVFAPRLTEVLEELLGWPPVAINSLNFKYGSQQPDHIDTWYMPPPKPGSLIVASSCLEDTHPDAGPLFYYPGSHQIPPYVFSHGRIDAIDAEMPDCRRYLDQEVANRGLKKEIFMGKKGDVFIWHCQLLHGGSPIADLKRTRASLVVHYWGKNAILPTQIKKTESGGRFLDRDYWHTDGKDIPVSKSEPVQAESLAPVAAVPPIPSAAVPDAAARKHVAFETWEGRGESLEAIEARIHDGAPIAKLRARAAGYLDMFEALFPDSVPAHRGSILEIGSGVGYVLEEALRRYRPTRLVGLDIAAGMIDFAKQRLHRDNVDTRAIEFVHYDGIDAPLPDASLDLVYSVASLQHAPRPYCFRALMEAYRLITPGGIAWIHLLAYSHFRAHMTPEHYKHEVLQQIQEQQGHWHHYYTVEEIETTLHYGVGIPADSIRVQERGGSLFICLRKP